ncbi:MAG: tetratricopeptide (TPR) repeat protein [Alphaproteobacteria bacterium]|jgi:tetratricopeptide (TPR) repeat protein
MNPADIKTLKKGIALHRSGDFPKAEKLYRRLLKTNPGDPELLHLLGLTYDATGRSDEASKTISLAIEKNGRNPTYRVNLGLVLGRQGRAAEALAEFDWALALKPGDPVANFNAGVLHEQLGETDAAILRYREVIEVDPRVTSAFNNLANILFKKGAGQEAVELLTRALKNDPDQYECRFNLARILNALNAFDRALPHARSCVSANPQHAEACFELGNALVQTGNHAEGIEAYDDALRLLPDNVAAQSNKGLALLETGDIAAAVAELEAAIQLDNTYGPAHFNLALASPSVDAGRQLERVQAALAGKPSGREHEMYLRFAEAIRLDALGRFDEAFDAFSMANDLVEPGYDADATEVMVGEVISTFTAEMFASRADFGSASAHPVFIVGMPRSGTSLVEQILASHPSVAGGGERWTFDLLTLAVGGFMKSSASYPGCFLEMTREQSKELADQLEGEMREIAGERPRLTDKLPGNFMNLGVIALLFPNATIIHCRRNSLAVGLSCFMTKFREDPAFAYDLETIGHFYTQYQRLMAHWQENLPAKIVEVEYEDLVGNPDTKIPALIAACRLDWDERCLRPHETVRSVRTASLSQVRRPIYGGSVEKWRSYEQHLAPLILAINRADEAHT